MKLSNDDKSFLINWGFTDKDFSQIERATNKSKTTYEMQGNQITREEAIDLLGKKEYLSGLSRSAFHCTACITNENGINVYFDSSKLLK